jgi:hypothetical protein
MLKFKVMILPFSTEYKDGTPTKFIEKIWLGILQHIPETTGLNHFEELYFEKFGQYWHGASDCTLIPKLHTIREDIHDRWHEGSLIHPVVFNRSKNQFQFAPTLVCKLVQEIEITHWHGIDGYRTVLVGDRILNETEIEVLAKNDGFNSVVDFFDWFSHDYTGKIIHWTNHKY